MIWRVRGRDIPTGNGTLVMGIVNVTPDSFFDGGRLSSTEDAVAHGLRLLEEGADLLDIGGESSRPGAEPVCAETELERVIPVISRLARIRREAILSVDTTKAAVAERAVEAGASVINDISALRFDPRMGEVAAVTGAGLALMHMQGEPRTMQDDPHYENLLGQLAAFFKERAAAAAAAGVKLEALVFDPGIGFGKTLEHNLEIIRRLKELQKLGRPILLGPSRKSFIGKLLENLPPEQRLEGTAAAVALGVANGAQIVRVHDVKEMKRVVRVADAVAGRGRRTG